MVFLRSSLALCILGTILGTTATPHQGNGDTAQSQERLKRNFDSPFPSASLPFSVDWGTLSNDAHSLLSNLQGMKTNSLLTSAQPTPAAPPTSHSSNASPTAKPPSTSSRPSSSSSSKPIPSSLPATSAPTSSILTSSSKPASPSSPSSTKPSPTSSSGPTGPASTGKTIQRPVFAVYTDESGFPTSDQIAGFNVLIISFFLSSGPSDQVFAWQSLPASERASMMADYKANGISLMVSAMGAIDIPTTLGVDPTTFAQSLAAWAVQFEMAGVDVDYEDFSAVAAGTAFSWLMTFTSTLRAALPSNMVISQAPVAPWLSPKQLYNDIEQEIGNLIDWYNVQFYSQGNLYTTCDGLLKESGDPFPQSSVFEIIAAGIPKEKVVIGKPARFADVADFSLGHLRRQLKRAAATPTSSAASTSTSTSSVNTNGFLDPSVLSQCLATAVAQGWNAGVMAWEYPDANAAWIQQVRTPAFP